MPNFIIYYDVSYGNDLITGNATTVRSEPPPTTADEAAVTLIASIHATAPNATVLIRGVREVSTEDFDRLIDLMRPQ